jgi:hypothetical protein
MILRKSKDKEYYYCSSFIRTHECTNHSIRKDKLEELVLNDIENQNQHKNINGICDKILNNLIDEIIIYDKNKVKVIYK